MAKPSTAYNDVSLWEDHCAELKALPFPATERDALRIVEPGIAKQLDSFGPGTSRFNGNTFAEARVPIARAKALLAKAAAAKTPATKLKHLDVARRWLATTHPWAGDKTLKDLRVWTARIAKEIERQSAKMEAG